MKLVNSCGPIVPLQGASKMYGLQRASSMSKLHRPGVAGTPGENSM